MATTTNYGWDTPDDTDLVKDGASAIRTLGSSIDTTTKNLNPETTLGDISYRSSTANTNTRLALGTAGQVLTVNSGATAPEWATPSSGGMTLISTTTLTGASVALTSIPQTYKHLEIVMINFLPATDNVSCKLLLNGDNTANRYASITSLATNNTTTFGSSDLTCSPNADNTVASNISYIFIPDYTNALTWKICTIFAAAVDSATNTSLRNTQSFSYYNQTNAITSLSFNPSSGNFTSGTIYLYGVK